MEIEKKYLLSYLPLDIHEVSRSNIEQHYFMLEGKSEARVRLKEKAGKKSFYLTIKAGEGMTRTEVELPISEAQYDELASTTGRSVIKTRIVTEEGFEVDLYHGHLEGLATVEKEFQTEEEANSFTPPDWFGRDVTNDSRYKNKNLAQGLWDEE